MIMMNYGVIGPPIALDANKGEALDYKSRCQQSFQSNFKRFEVKKLWINSYLKNTRGSECLKFGG